MSDNFDEHLTLFEKFFRSDIYDIKLVWRQQSALPLEATFHDLAAFYTVSGQPARLPRGREGGVQWYRGVEGQEMYRDLEGPPEGRESTGNTWTQTMIAVPG